QRELAFSGHLGLARDGVDDESFARSFAERLSAERGGAEFVNAFEKRSSGRLTSRSRRVTTSRPSIIPFLVAAALAIAVVGLVVRSAEQNAPKDIVRKEPLPVPPPPEEPKPEPPPVVPPTPEAPVRAP